MRICYLYDRSIPKTDNLINGIDRKVLSQVNCFRSHGWQCDIVSPKRLGGVATMLQILPCLPDRTVWHSVVNERADVFYIRRPVYCSKQFVQSMADLRNSNPKALFLYEIPTYPYDAELSTFRYQGILIKDRWHRRKLNSFVDAIVDLSGTECIFKVPTVQMINGIDLTEVAPRVNGKPSDGSVDIICVASFAPWHGADRLIEGLAAYYEKDEKRPVRLHLLGGGSEIGKLKELALKLKMQNNIVFYGPCSRSQMDEVYDFCDLAVASLGLHRIKLAGASTLKTREYLAKGIPFVYSGKIDVFENSPVDFCMNIPPDDDPVCVVDVVRFIDNLLECESVDGLTERIRAYAECHVGIESAMKNVIMRIESVRLP